MAKTVDDCLFLYELLMDKDIENQTLETVSAVVQKRFSKSDYLSVATLMTTLIRNGDLFGIIQKIGAYYVIYDLFEEYGQNETSFLTVFLHAIEQKEVISKGNVIEKNFVAQLLRVGGAKDLAKQTPSQIVAQDVTKLNVDLTALKIHNCELKKELTTELPAAFAMMEEDVKHETAFYDTTISSPTIISSDAKRLIVSAYNEALNIRDFHLLLSELEKDPNIVHYIGIAPASLPDLVENNPLVAISILQKLTQSTQITDYFNVLVNMEVSLYSMEVVKGLAISGDLSAEYVRLFISNSINVCESLNDTYVQTRLVRLLCVFLHSLLENKVINVNDLLAEVKGFCVDFSRIHEVAKLYRLLKQ